MRPDGRWRFDKDFAEPVVAAGFSGECLVMVAPQQKMAWRSCSLCSSPPFATTTGGVLSRDGTAFLGQDTGNVAGTTLWNVLGNADAVASYPPRPEEASWGASEVPIAVSAHGHRVITGARILANCGNWPGFTSRIHDVASDSVLDELPPGVTSTSADLDIVTIGPVLWCAR